MAAPTPLNSPIVTGQVQLSVGPPTYSAGGGSFNPADGATDFLTVANGGTRTVQVLYIAVFGWRAAGGLTAPLILIKRSTVDTGGTSTTATNVPLDSTNPTSQAIVKRYTVNPTVLGAAVGNLDIQNWALITDAGGTPAGAVVFAPPAAGQSQLFTVRGTEQLCVSGNGASWGTVVAYFRVMWAEV